MAQLTCVGEVEERGWGDKLKVKSHGTDSFLCEKRFRAAVCAACHSSPSHYSLCEPIISLCEATSPDQTLLSLSIPWLQFR